MRLWRFCGYDLVKFRSSKAVIQLDQCHVMLNTERYLYPSSRFAFRNPHCRHSARANDENSLLELTNAKARW